MCHIVDSTAELLKRGEDLMWAGRAFQWNIDLGKCVLSSGDLSVRECMNVS